MSTTINIDEIVQAMMDEGNQLRIAIETHHSTGQPILHLTEGKYQNVLEAMTRIQEINHRIFAIVQHAMEIAKQM